MSDAVIRVKGASFSYREKEVFNNLSFAVKAGEIFCLVGPNGCGKTTLLDCLLGVLKLKQGQIFVNEQNLFALSAKERAKKMAYIPQRHKRTFPYTVEEIVLMGRAHNTGIFSSPKEEDRHIALEAMEKVRISSLAQKPYTQISGGEGQLVMIARALAQQAQIIIMDEPTAHLDFKNELVFLETVAQLAKQRGITIIMATHFPNHAYYFENNSIPTTLALMDNGNFQAIGNPRQILNEANIKKIYGVYSKVITCNIEDKDFIRQIIPLSLVQEAENHWREGSTDEVLT